MDILLATLKHFFLFKLELSITMARLQQHNIWTHEFSYVEYSSMPLKWQELKSHSFVLASESTAHAYSDGCHTGHTEGRG